MTLYFFYGKECPHCQKMEPLVDNLEDAVFEIERLETWHDEDNAEKKEELDDGKCGVWGSSVLLQHRDRGPDMWRDQLLRSRRMGSILIYLSYTYCTHKHMHTLSSLQPF